MADRQRLQSSWLPSNIFYFLQNVYFSDSMMTISLGDFLLLFVTGLKRKFVFKNIILSFKLEKLCLVFLKLFLKSFPDVAKLDTFYWVFSCRSITGVIIPFIRKRFCLFCLLYYYDGGKFSFLDNLMDWSIKVYPWGSGGTKGKY